MTQDYQYLKKQINIVTIPDFSINWFQTTLKKNAVAVPVNDECLSMFSGDLPSTVKVNHDGEEWFVDGPVHIACTEDSNWKRR